MLIVHDILHRYRLCNNFHTFYNILEYLEIKKYSGISWNSKIFWNILTFSNILEYLEIPKYSGISWHFPIFWNILRLKNILEYLEIPKYSGISTNHQPPMSIHQAWNNKQQTTNLMTYNHNHQLLMTNIHILTMDNQNNLPPTNHQWESIKEKKQPTTNN